MRGLKPFLTLLTGASLAQVLPLLLMPVLTRIYTPADFGVYWAFVAAVSLFAVSAAGRYEFAVGLPDNDREASSVAALAFVLATGVGLLLVALALSVTFLAPELLTHKTLRQFGPHISLVGIGIGLLGLFQVLNFWLIRKAAFKHAAILKLIQAGMGSLFAVLLWHWGSKGWVLSYLIGFGLAAAWGYRIAVRQGLDLSAVSLGSMRKTMTAYRQFPGNALPAIMDSAGLWFPVLFVAAVFATDFVGHFTLSRQILGAPISLIAVALSQAMYQQLIARSQQGLDLVSYLRNYALILSGLGLTGAVIITAWGGQLFALVFGASWEEAGELSQILVWAYAIRLVGSPLSIVLPAVGAMRSLGIWQVCHFLVIIAICLPSYERPLSFVYVYVGAEIAMYAAYIVTSFIAAARHDRDLLTRLQSEENADRAPQVVP